MIRLAHYRMAAKYPRPHIPISNGVPDDILVTERYREFDPSWNNVSDYRAGILTWDRFVDLYWRQLETLWSTRRELFGYLELRGGTCFCYCTPGDRCHRRILACFCLKVGFEVELDGKRLPSNWEEIW